MLDVAELRLMAEEWRNKAARVRAKYHGMGELANAAQAGATAFETCAEELEEAVGKAEGLRLKAEVGTECEGGAS